MSNDKPVFIVEGVQVYADGKPVVQEPAQIATPAGGEELEKLRADRDSLFGQVQGLRGEREDALSLAAQNGRLLREAQQDLAKASEDHRLTLERLLAESKERVAALDAATQERNTAQAEAASVREALEGAQRQVEFGKNQLTTLASKVAELEARPVLPPDALERIKKVPGLADKFGKPIIEALTAPPAESPSE